MATADASAESGGRTGSRATTSASTSTTDGKRARILDAALRLFAERGFHGTTVPAVAKAAGVGAGTIYRYFDSKETLGNTLYQKWKRQIAAMVIGAFPTARPPREQFRWIWQQMAAFATGNPEAFAFLELNNHRLYADDVSRQIETRLLEFAISWVEHAQAMQVLKPISPGVLIAVVMGAFSGLIRAAWEHRLELTPEHVDAAERCCWEAIRQ